MLGLVAVVISAKLDEVLRDGWSPIAQPAVQDVIQFERSAARTGEPGARTDADAIPGAYDRRYGLRDRVPA